MNNIEEILVSMTEGRAVFAGIVIAGLYYMLLFDGGDTYKKQIVTHNQTIKKNETHTFKSM